jgi:small subunit ribosomal protein S20
LHFDKNYDILLVAVYTIRFREVKSKMPNIKSAKKRVLISRDRRDRNKARRSELRTKLKRARGEEATAVQIKDAVVMVDKAAGKGIIHRNKAARLKSQLAKKQNSASA